MGPLDWPQACVERISAIANATPLVAILDQVDERPRFRFTKLLTGQL